MSLFGFRRLWLLVLVLSFAGCPCVNSVVNSSPELRWWLFSNFGAGKMCPEMLKRGAALKLSPGGNTIGRFFPNQCHHEVDDANKLVTIHFAGTGYAWTPVAGRIGFSCSAGVEYRPDFQMTDDAVYVWAKTNRIVYGPDFSIGAVEYKVVDWAARTPVGYLANTFGAQIVSSQLTSGFTVVRTDQGDDFSVGILTPPERPTHPFKVKDEERFVFANETTEVRNGQVDFLGPFEVTDTDQALFLRMKLDGPALDALVMGRQAADEWRDALQRGAQLAQPPYPAEQTFVIQPGGEQEQRLRLPPGEHVIVVDNSANVGQVSPPWNPLSVVGANGATLSYSAELGDAD